MTCWHLNHNIFLNIEGVNYASEWLNRLGVKVRPVPPHPIICSELFVPSYSQHCGFFSADFQKWLVNNSGPRWLSSDEPAKRIYISRTGTRKIKNEHQLIKKLSEYHFQVFELENMSTQEQQYLFSQAELIIAPHGAGLTNLIFTKPSAKVLEFFSSSYQNACYSSLCALNGIDYYYNVSENSEINGDYAVDPLIIDKFIKFV